MSEFDDKVLALADLCESMIDKAALGSAKLLVRENKNGRAIVIASPLSAYRPAVENILFVKYLYSKGRGYVLFKKAYLDDFDSAGLKGYLSDDGYVYADGFFRITFEDFTLLCKKEAEKIKKILTKIFISCLSFPAFGCCDKYALCSKKGHCLHEDLVYATACQYRKNLESGKIFYS